jgi:hypothetical protein
MAMAVKHTYLAAAESSGRSKSCDAVPSRPFSYTFFGKCKKVFAGPRHAQDFTLAMI